MRVPVTPVSLVDKLAPCIHSLAMHWSPRIGIFHLQGAFAEHACCLQRAFAVLLASGDPLTPSSHLEVVRVRRPENLDGLDALIIPGGESTTMAKFLQKDNFVEDVIKWLRGKISIKVRILNGVWYFASRNCL